jgi:hypothetical protein
VIALSVVAGLFPKPHVVSIFGASTIFFLVGAVVSALVMRDIVHDLDDADDRLHRTNRQFFAWAAFYLALFLFGLFAVYNFLKS